MSIHVFLNMWMFQNEQLKVTDKEASSTFTCTLDYKYRYAQIYVVVPRYLKKKKSGLFYYFSFRTLLP
jgi:hypothetical protein